MSVRQNLIKFLLFAVLGTVLIYGAVGFLGGEYSVWSFGISLWYVPAYYFLLHYLIYVKPALLQQSAIESARYSIDFSPQTQQGKQKWYQKKFSAGFYAGSFSLACLGLLVFSGFVFSGGDKGMADLVVIPLVGLLHAPILLYFILKLTQFVVEPIANPETRCGQKPQATGFLANVVFVAEIAAYAGIAVRIADMVGSLLFWSIPILCCFDWVYGPLFYISFIIVAIAWIHHFFTVQQTYVHRKLVSMAFLLVIVLLLLFLVY
jgi:hypothetical protein